MSADVLMRGDAFRPLSEAAKAYFSKFGSLGGWVLANREFEVSWLPQGTIPAITFSPM